MTDHLRAMVLDDDYPCVGAKSVFTRHTARIEVFDELADPTSTELYEGLTDYATSVARDAEDTEFVSYVAVFAGPTVASETSFEELLWRQLGLLHEQDVCAGNAPDPAVSSDPSHPHFGFSLAGTAFFVIGMHPAASRMARQTPWPVLVFNLHRQFEALRASGRYERVRDTVRRRDARLQGSTNPMVADHGSVSEARQYSGRDVPDGWQPPSSYTSPQEGTR